MSECDRPGTGQPFTAWLLLLWIHMEDSMLSHEIGQGGTGKFPGYVTDSHTTQISFR